MSEISYLLKFLTQGNHGMVIVTQISNLSSASPSPNFHSAERLLKSKHCYRYLARYFYKVFIYKVGIFYLCQLPTSKIEKFPTLV